MGRNSLPARRSYCEPARKSSRVNVKPVSYDDDIEILEVDDTHNKSKSINPAKNIDERKFGKLTLSAKRKIVYYNNHKEDELENKKVPIVKRNIKKSSAHGIEVIDIDDEAQDKKIQIQCKSSSVRITRKEDEEILLTEDDDDDRKRKSNIKLSTAPNKKLKTGDSHMIEVKSSSGKSMFVNKATLEKIMATKALQKSTLSENHFLDEKLLAEDGDIVKSVILAPKKTRSRGL